VRWVGIVLTLVLFAGSAWFALSYLIIHITILYRGRIDEDTNFTGLEWNELPQPPPRGVGVRLYAGLVTVFEIAFILIVIRCIVSLLANLHH
jgi:hypothetical protein